MLDVFLRVVIIVDIKIVFIGVDELVSLKEFIV